MKTPWIVALVALIVVLFLSMRKDGFTSPGTMVQLATSHVPTEQDVYYMKNIYPKIVRRDITDMTGGDPGPISVPMPQL